MSNVTVTLKRWQIAASFVAIVVVSALTIWLHDHRIDNAIKRSNVAVLASAQANAKASAAQAANRVQDAVRRDLVSLFCNEIESIKERIRATAMVDRREFRLTLERLNIDPDSQQGQALLLQAFEQERELQERFAPLDCGDVPGG